MVNNNLMDQLDSLGFGADVDKLESYVATLQDAAAIGEPIVPDQVYDVYFALLRQLRPESNVVNRNWEVEDNDYGEDDEILKEYGMASITTIKTMDGLNKFREGIAGDTVDLMFSSKLNGHGVRAVYRCGKLVGGSTRGRYKKGRDILRHLKAVLPLEVPEWSNVRLMEVRGELLVDLTNFKSRFANTLKTPLSTVTSLVRDSVTDEELNYLDMVCYQLLPCDESPIKFETLEDKFKELARCGFKTPPYRIYTGIQYYNLDDAVDEAIQYFESIYETPELNYLCDGVVATVNNIEQFESLGYDGKNRLGNFALKMGNEWGTQIYSGTVKTILFMHGKKYLTPKAEIFPVKTVTGAEVTTVPLYNVGVMERFHIIPGANVFFRFGGETGVTLVDANGTPISELD